ncbi:MAG: L-threonine 3-dehydrogenase [Candidatus Methanofastidiosia archaeon]
MQSKMRAVVKTNPSPGAELMEVEVPATEPQDVLVKVKATSICGSDLHLYIWNSWASSRVELPRIMGHEFCGEVVEVGKDVSTHSVGDYVSCKTHIICNRCYQCRIGRGDICQNLKIIGFERDGSFAEYIAIPAQNAWINSPHLKPEIATLQEPLGNAVHTVFSGEVASKNVTVLGCGPIGLMSVALSKIGGATKVFATDINPYRLRLAEKMGADFVLDAREDVVSEILGETLGEGVDVVLEMSGSPVALKQGFKIIRNGGRFSLLGLPSEPVMIDVSKEIIFKGITLQGITGRRMFETWYKVKSFLDSGMLDISPIITHKIKLEEFEKGMELMKSGDCGKVMMFL